MTERTKHTLDQHTHQPTKHTRPPPQPCNDPKGWGKARGNKKPEKDREEQGQEDRHEVQRKSCKTLHQKQRELAQHE